jgi:DNA-binding response OmpR family regulator
VDQQPRILIVDDEPFGQQLLEAVLMEEDYHLLFAENGQKAISYIHEFLPDLVLLDVMMPEMDGFEVCQKIRSDDHLKSIPIILITALDDRDSRKKGIEAGANDYISKPFDRNEVLVKVKNFLK